MEPQAALVWSHGRIELDAEAAVDLDAVLVVGPGHAEDDLALGFANPLDQGIVQVFGMLCHHPSQAFQHLAHGLVELGLTGIAPDDLVIDGGQLVVDLDHVHCPFVIPTAGLAVILCKLNGQARHKQAKYAWFRQKQESPLQLFPQCRVYEGSSKRNAR